MKTYLIIMCLFCAPAALSQSFISLQSDQGDWIGSGQQHELTGEFELTISKSQISINHASGFNFLFIPPNNVDLEEGAFLLAERAPFKGPLNPGMSVGSPGRGCNTITGEFYIYEMEFSNDNKALAMDFIQFCDSNTAKLTGSIRINSSVEAPYNYPLAVIVQKTSPVIEGQDFIVNASSSLSQNSEIETYLWEYVSGPELIIESVNNVETSISAPTNIKLGGEKSVLKLTVTDKLGQSDIIEQLVTIKSKSDPQSYFTMQSETGDYIGAGRDWLYDLATSTITASKNYDNGVSVSINGSEHWSADFAAPDEVQLEVGEYNYAERFPFQAAGTAGISISGNGRGCNQNFGSFVVRKLTWENDQPTEFMASFTQHCEQVSAPALTGEIAINAVHESVPVSNAGADIEVKEGEIIQLNGSDSYDNLGDLASYSWQTLDEDIEISNAEESRAFFTAPLLSSKEENLVIQASLLVIDNEGYKSIDKVSITVLADNSSPISTDDNIETLVASTIEILPLSNDSDSDGSLQIDTINIIKAPSYGTAIVKSNGGIEYTHTGEIATEDTIEYTVKDNDGGISNIAIIKITVNEQSSETVPDIPDTSTTDTATDDTAVDDTSTTDTATDDTAVDDTSTTDTATDDTALDDTATPDPVVEEIESESSSGGTFSILSLLFIFLILGIKLAHLNRR